MTEWQRTLRRLLTLANYVHASAALNVLVREYVRAHEHKRPASL